ncbi:MAG: RsmB/NOP family class I SAM-dependent RNA methyltransferase [Methylobacteriaceae bacterium]|jgi:16S rRNA (cytosine967-C5)-methyltransferase|nr:RsmB/NOP family class I SAM-dependent RNA methyltransferase [Methylobacteriaceae bacterium]
MAPPAPRDSLTARLWAANAYREVLAGRTPIPEALRRSKPSAATAFDEQFAAAIVAAAFRRRGSIGAVLERRLPRGLPKDRRVAAFLFTGAAELMVLGTPPYAVVDSMVAITRGDAKTRFASGLINAVLRKVGDDPEPLGAGRLDDIPEWLRKRWLRRYGLETTGRIADVFRFPANVDITLKEPAAPLSPAQWAERLEGVVLPSGSIRLTHKRPVHTLPGFSEGAWWVQDMAAALPVKMLAPQKGENILDLCAAPGGKTAQLAAAGAVVTAVDISESRMQRLQENLKRLALDATLCVGDALKFPESPFDAVLLDAPCSATGTIRRHPELPWIRGESDIAGLVRLQENLLEKAARCVRPGGRLVYAACSLEPEEGEEQIRRFLNRHREFVREESGVAAGWRNREGDMRILPPDIPAIDDLPELGGADGFFAAVVRRKTGPDDLHK